MSSSLWVGTTGLAASEKQVSVLGNNLANANTVGFKASDTNFASMLSQSSGSGSQRVGQGVMVSAVSTSFSQGSFQSTGNATDIAIDGNGFFILKDQEGSSYYTRAGAFNVNKEGLLCDINGYTVQGYMFENGIEVKAQTNLDLRNVLSIPKASTTFNIGLTLDSQMETGGTFESSQIIYDSRGAPHTLGTTFTKMEDTRYWSVQNRLDGGEATSQSYSGIKFDSLGNIDKVYSSIATDTYSHAVTSASATMVENNNGQMYKDTIAGITLTRGAAENSWVITPTSTTFSVTSAGTATKVDNNIGEMNKDTTGAGIILTRVDVDTWTFTDGGYTGMTIDLGDATDDLVSIDLDGVGGADVTFTLAGTWAVGDNIRFDIVTKKDGGYDNMTMIDTGADDQVSIDLDGVGGADVTFNLTGTWGANDTITLNIAQTEVDAADIDVRFYATGSALPDGSTIGTDGVLNWNIAGVGAPSMTSFATTSRINSVSNDGYSSGTLSGLDINDSGVVEGMFTNGKRQDLARILLADFANMQGLNRIGNYFVASGDSGDAIINNPGSGGVGSLQSSSLEMSNTDVAAEFIKMIMAQRAYQANAKVIMTSDQMLQQLMAIKQ